jgi:hypothetical protein
VPLVATLGSGRAVKVTFSVDLQEAIPAANRTAIIISFILIGI